MDSSPSHSPSPAAIHRRSLVDELQIGHCAAEQLRRRLFPSPSSSPGNEEVMSDYDLTEAIVNSFSNSLSIAMSCDGLLANCAADGCKIEDSGGGDGEKSSRSKDRRGCYKRRRRGQTWTKEDKAPTEDSFAWRKYGQKPILNSKFPRNYYRCTHRDQGCDAVKQVQKISDDPPLYRTTYSGHHTCKTPHNTSEIILQDQPDSPFFLSFGGSSNTITTPPINNNAFFQSSNHTMAFKQEHTNLPTTTTTQAATMMLNQLNQSSYSDHNYLSSSDPATLSGGAATPAGSAGDVLSGGAYSCSPSPHSLEMDNYMHTMLGQAGDFDHNFQFECDI